MTARPYNYSPLFFFMFYVLLTQGVAKSRKRYFMPLLLMLWANIHGAYIIAVFVLLLDAIDLVKNKRWSRGRYRNGIELTTILLSVSATLINPNPLGLLFRIYEAPTYPSLDWKPLHWWLYNSPLQVLPVLFAYLFVIFVCIVSFGRRRGKNEQTNYMNAYCDFFCLLVPLLHFRLNWLLVFAGLNNLSSLRTTSQIGLKNPVDYATVAILSLCVAFFQWSPPKESIYKLPRGALKFIEDNNLRGNVFCPWQWSGYVIWKTGKTCKIFVDTRVEPYEEKYIQLHFLYLRYPLFSVVDLVAHGTDYVLIPIDDNVVQWNCLSRDGYIEFLYRDGYTFLGRIVKEKVRELEGVSQI